MSGQKHRFKIVLLGEGRVGKTSIVLRYVKQKYAATTQETDQVRASYCGVGVGVGWVVQGLGWGVMRC